MAKYDSLGKGYNQTRQPDPRIVDQLLSWLDLPEQSIIADIGAGTGNYSRAIADRGYQVIAIEPSIVMQSQALDHEQVRWITATAESIPLEDNTVDGAIVMLALHHFQDIKTGIKEIARITSGEKIVIFAFEQSKISDFWLTDYFPHFIQDTLATFPATSVLAQQIQQITQRQVKVMPFLLPPDLKDLFAAAGWQKPEVYLDPAVRRGISTFAKIPSFELEQGINQLAQDLEKGRWLQKYGHLIKQQTYDAGYRILIVK